MGESFVDHAPGSIVADMDNDGWKDIFTANSHVNARIGDFQARAFQRET
jgi:hypothetical protein